MQMCLCRFLRGSSARQVLQAPTLDSALLDWHLRFHDLAFLSCRDRTIDVGDSRQLSPIILIIRRVSRAHTPRFSIRIGVLEVLRVPFFPRFRNNREPRICDSRLGSRVVRVLSACIVCRIVRDIWINIQPANSKGISLLRAYR